MLNLSLIILSAVLTGLAFPPCNFFYLAFIGLAPLFYVMSGVSDYKTTAKYALLWGFVFYMQILGGLLAMQEYAPLILLLLATVAFALAETLFILAALLVGKFIQKNPIGRGFIRVLIAALGYAFAWVLFDWLRSLGMWRFTGGGLAYSQYLFTEFIQLARYIGAHGLTFVIVLLNALTGICAARIRTASSMEKRNWLIALLVFFILGCLTFYFIGLDLELAAQEKHPQKRITVYQPAIPQETKLDYDNQEEIRQIYLNNIRAYSQQNKTDLLIMPETIVPEFLLENKEFLFALRDALGFSLIFGTPRREKNDPRWYNSVVLLNRYGSVTVLHDKKYLVPFGEYIPFRPLFARLLRKLGLLKSEYSPGIRNMPAIDAPDYAVAICFESLFSYQLREQISKGGRLILVITNDAWFGRTRILDMHLSFAVLRAVENNRYVLQAANTGRSAIIDNRGRILRISDIDVQDWLESEVSIVKYPAIYTFLGEGTIYLALVFFLLYLYFFLTSKAREQ